MAHSCVLFCVNRLRDIFIRNFLLSTAPSYLLEHADSIFGCLAASQAIKKCCSVHYQDPKINLHVISNYLVVLESIEILANMILIYSKLYIVIRENLMFETKRIQVTHFR